VRSKFTIDEQEHYVFNPRDLTAWILSLLRYEVASNEALYEAWAYEASRMFRDRLVGQEAKADFDATLQNLMIQHFGVAVQADKLFFTSLLTMGDEGVPKGDMKRVSQEDYLTMVGHGFRSYNTEVKDLPIELFSEVVDHLTWMDRALSAPTFSDVLLVGSSGVGRRSVVLLMSHMHHLNLFTPVPTKKYDDKEWKRDLKQVMQMTGVEKQHTVLFLEDHHLVKSSFLECLNSLLSAGEVPGIYAPEELEPLLAPIKEEWASSQGRGGTARSPFEYFVMQVRHHLRIVLSMDAKHPHFLPFCASNPAIFSCCNVMWLEDWSEQSKSFLIEKRIGEVIESKKQVLQPLIMRIHESQKANGATPRHFVTFLQAVQDIYKMKVTSQSGQSSHLQKGLQKLQEVSETVKQLQADAVVKQKELEDKQRLASDALTRITNAMQQAADRRKEVEQLEQATQDDQQKNEAEKEKIEQELSEIQPILDAAKKAVGSIKPEHLNEIRSLKMPPEPIHDVLNGVLRLMGNYDSSWASMKKFLAGSGAIQRILNFNPREISESVRNDVEKLLHEKSNSFDHATIYRVSVAAAPLAKWVVACVRYSAVLVKVSPMEQQLEAAGVNLQQARGRLEECRQQLGGIDSEVAKLREEFEARTREAEVLKVDLERATTTLQKANHLTGKMSGEKERWQQQVADIKRDAELLSTHTVLAAAYCTYLGHFSEDVRGEAQAQWLQATNMDGFDFLRIMSSESELLTWKSQGLSADRLSQENAVIIKSYSNVPFIVDPNSQAVEWLKSYVSNAETVLQQDPKVSSQLELSVRFGKTIIIQEVDGIDNFLFPLLRKDLVRQGPRNVVQVGEKVCDYNENFRLYLCTRNSNAIDNLPPNSSCLVTGVNFSVTRAGLEGQLLGIILQHEKPELEERKSELLKREEDFKVQLADLEKQLLTQLAEASGNILENESLIQSLEKTKAASTTISESLAESSRLQLDLDQQREVYRPLATLGSKIFILIRDVSVMDHMYRFSLESFIFLFNKVLNLQINAGSTEEKLRGLGSQLNIMVLFSVSRSLFKGDRLTFGIHLVRGIMPQMFEASEWELFQGTFVPAGEPSTQAPPWCPPDRIPALQGLRAAFPKIDEKWSLNKDLWGQWVSSDKCEDAFDTATYSRMSAFQRVLLIQAVRPDRLESMLTRFACDAIGVPSLSGPPLSLPRLHKEESSAKVPILFVTTPGADPSLELEEFAKQYAEESSVNMNFHQLAMGGGQNDDAIKLLHEAASKGDWVCLKNLHLVINWVPLLEKVIKNLEPHENFRCWLTTEPHAKFPSILLETSLKVTYEAPPGIKKNLLRTLESWNPGWFASGNELRSQVMFMCAHFHAIVQERRTYIPQGWTKFYEFSQSDLQSACETVSLLVTAAGNTQGGPGIDWQTLIGVLEMAIYGSRVDNDFDSRLAREYLSLCFRSDVVDRGMRKDVALAIPPFNLPQTKDLRDFRASVEKMSDTDNPASFGLAPNADRSLQRINSKRVIDTLRHLASAAGVLEGGDSGSGGLMIRAWKEHLNPLWKMWDNVTKAQLSKLRGAEIRNVKPDDPPVVAFVLMDALEASQLVDRVAASLSNIQKVVNGTGLSTPDIQGEASCLMRSQVPPNWSATWPSAPEDPALFLQGLGKRVSALKGEWLKRIGSPDAFSQPVCLANFLRPDVFLNALRQQTARRLSVSIDSLHLVASFEAHLLSDAQICPLPVTVQELLLEGCSFDESRRILVESTRTSALTSVLPPLTIAWMSTEMQSERARSSARNATPVAMPIYVSLNRERLIGEVHLHTDSRQQRVLNSAALFLTEND